MTTLNWNGNWGEGTLGLGIARGLAAPRAPATDLAPQTARTAAPDPDARSRQWTAVRPAGRPLGRSLLAFLAYAALLLAWYELRHLAAPGAPRAQLASAVAERAR